MPQTAMPSHPALNTQFRDGFRPGYSAITREEKGKNGTGVDFGIHVLAAGDRVEETSSKETVWVLLKGEAELSWPGGQARVKRESLFDQEPTALHVSIGTKVTVRSLGGGTEWAVSRVTNAVQFSPALFLPQDVKPEYRGKELVQGACLRNVRLIFDKKNRPEANLVAGEVVNYPGRWSSYPPHHHNQPEIYHYRFTLPQGYGHAELGEEVFKVKHGDTLQISGGHDHSQVSAPGYGMYYLWVVKHLPNDPYLGFEFTEEHRWILDPKNQGWEPRK